MKPTPGLMWGTATLMVTIVSCCSLVGVSIMPLISGRSYKSSITLFTGLAVGSLLGSAIFSLIPQAFSLHLQADKAYLWKSLIIFLGIYMFYCSERCMRIYFYQKTKKQEQKRTDSSCGQLQLTNCSDEDKQLQTSSNSKTTSNLRNSGATQSAAISAVDSRGNEHHDKEIMTEIDLRKASLGGDETIPLETGHNAPNQHQIHQHHHHHDHDLIKPHEIITRALKRESANATKQSGSVPNPPNTPRKANEIAPVAWMIIIGDGLHNFIDGLSIGAAFTESIYQGIIICVAVIFEELPHELGDFAVLISSGMTVRQALGFNFLSACTCYIGMVFGIILGDTTQSASYIFALAAGMFFYISLVDMMGELSAALEECKHSTREYARLLLMQNIGILTGISIIFSLSLFGPGG